MSGIEITWRELTAAGLRAAAGKCRDARAARRMPALAPVLEGVDRTRAAGTCGMDRQTLRDRVHRDNAEFPESARGKPLELRFRDEAGVGQQGTLTPIRAGRGTRPRAPHDRRHQRARLSGAVCPARGAAAGLVLPTVSTAAMKAHPAEISRSVAPGGPAVPVLDGAGWHGANALVIPDNLSLPILPPCSPELNPGESVRQYLRANWLAISVFDSCDAIPDACCTAGNNFANNPDIVTSITARPWAKVC